MMKDLTPSEIEELLGLAARRSAPVADSNGRRVMPYDFRQALHLSKEQHRVLLRVHEQFARLFTNELTMRLRLPIQIQVLDVVETTYEQFIAELPAITVVQVMGIETLDGQVLVRFDTDLVFKMLDSSLGGGHHQSYHERELTELETRLFSTLISQICSLYIKSWSPFCEFSAVLGPLENHPRFIQISPPSESVICVRLNCKVDQAMTAIQIIIPSVMLDKMVPKLGRRNPDSHRAPSQKDRHYRELMSHHLLQTNVKLALRLGEASLTMRQLLDLQEGDVIPLQQATDTPLSLCVDAQTIALASPGVLHGNYATRIVNVSNFLDAWKANT